MGCDVRSCQALPLSLFARVSEKSGGLEEVNYHGFTEINSLGCSLGSAPVVVNNGKMNKPNLLESM